jgi:hypothetical protein
VEDVDGDGTRVTRLIDRRRRQLHIVAQGRPRRAVFTTATVDARTVESAASVVVATGVLAGRGTGSVTGHFAGAGRSAG